MPSNKIHGKDEDWSEIQYKFEVDDESVNQSYHQMQVQK